MANNYTDEQLSSMPHTEILALRDKATSQEEQNRLAGFEHQAFQRENIAENPQRAPGAAILTVGYTTAKVAGVRQGRSDASLDQMSKGLTGIAEGVVAAVKKPWERLWQKAEEVIAPSPATSSTASPWQRLWQKEEVKPVEAPTKAKPTSSPPDFQIPPEVQATRDVQAGRIRVQEAGSEIQVQKDIAILEEGLKKNNLSREQRSLLKTQIKLLKTGMTVSENTNHPERKVFGREMSGEELRQIPGKAAEFVASVAPITGEILAAKDTIDYLSKGELKNAGLSAIGMIPIIGSLGKGIKTVTRSAHEVVVPLTKAERSFISSGEFSSYFQDFAKDQGLKWHEKPNWRLFDDGLSFHPIDEGLLNKFSKWLSDAPPGERKGIPPKFLNTEWEKSLKGETNG